MRATQLASTDALWLLNPYFFQNFLPKPANCQLAFGKPAPDFLLQSVDEKTYQLSSFRGKSVVLIFTRIFTGKQRRSICAPYILALSEIYPQFLSLGAELLIVGSTSLRDSKIIQKELSISAPFLSDSSCSSFRLYGTGKALGAPLPAQFVIDSEGRLRFQHLFSLAHTHATAARLLWAVRNL
ncbi:MAG: redoxin domain-containing protein [Cyanobacteria bacterium P01_D01_bin.105]